MVLPHDPLPLQCAFGLEFERVQPGRVPAYAEGFGNHLRGHGPILGREEGDDSSSIRFFVGRVKAQRELIVVMYVL